MKNKKLLFVAFFIVLFFSSCDNPQKEFNNISSQNDVKLFNQFIEKYSDHDLAKKATHIRDSLILTPLIEANSIDSLMGFVQDYPESDFVSEANKQINLLQIAELIHNAKKEGKTGLSSKSHVACAEAFEKSGTYYLEAIELQKKMEGETKELFEKAAYAYYKASICLKNEQLRIAYVSYAKNLEKGNFDIASIDKSVDSKTSTTKDKKTTLYKKSIELYKEANKNEHADWMEKGGDMKDFKSEEIENEWNS